MSFAFGLKFRKGLYHFSEELGGWTDDNNYPPQRFDTEEEATAYAQQKKAELISLMSDMRDRR